MGIKEDKETLEEIKEEITEIKSKEGFKHSFAWELLTMQKEEKQKLIIANICLSIALIISLLFNFYK